MLLVHAISGYFCNRKLKPWIMESGEIRKNKGKHYTAIHLGSLDQLASHHFVHPRLGHTVERKVFTGEELEATGAEISFQELPAHTEVPFLHRHHEHEEVYVVLKGTGQFKVDDEVFDIGEGSLVRIATNGDRTLRNTSDKSMVYMVIQTKENSLKKFQIWDGYRTVDKPAW